MRWMELEERVLAIIKYNVTDREKAELILIEFNQYEPETERLVEYTVPKTTG